MEKKKTVPALKVEKNDSDMVLKKHVGLIHCENRLSLIQRKICNILLFNALDQINERDIHEIPIRKLCSLVGYNSNDSKLIKESVKTLIATVMEWNLLEDSKFLNGESYPEEAIVWHASSLLAGASIKSGIIRYSYSPQIKSILSSLDIYGRINLFVQAKFNSSYSLVLYENCVRFKNISHTAWFSVELFRSLMGIPAGKYPSFKELKRNVINVAVNEINQKSDICLAPQFKRMCRSITALQFIITENESYQPSFKKTARSQDDALSEHAQYHAAMMEKLVSEFQLSRQQAKKVTIKYEKEYLLEKIDLVKSRNKIDHPGAYLLAALRQDYKKMEKARAQPGRVAEKTWQREAREASEIAPLKNKYMSYKLKTYTDFIKQQSDTLQTAIREEFESFLASNTEAFRFYRRSGLSSPFVMADFLAFIDRHFPAVIGNFLSFDDFLTTDESY